MTMNACTLVRTDRPAAVAAVDRSSRDGDDPVEVRADD